MPGLVKSYMIVSHCLVTLSDPCQFRFMASSQHTLVSALSTTHAHGTGTEDIQGPSIVLETDNISGLPPIILEYDARGTRMNISIQAQEFQPLQHLSRLLSSATKYTVETMLTPVDIRRLAFTPYTEAGAWRQ